jgi:hypothetical protein
MSDPKTPLATKNTPLRPAIWMTGVLVWANVIALIFRVPTWGAVFLCGLTGVSFLSYLVSYVYLMINDRDSLRREKFAARGTVALPEGTGPASAIDVSAMHREGSRRDL